MDNVIIGAIIGAVAVIIAAVIGLKKRDSEPNSTNVNSSSNSNSSSSSFSSSGTTIYINTKAVTKETEQDNITIDIPADTPTYNSGDYTHNAFIPSLEELEKTDSDDAFGEGLATFLGVDRGETDLTYTRKD